MTRTSDEPTLVGKSKFKSPITLEGSWGSRPLADNAECTMELFFYKDDTGFIEWDIPSLERTEHIGLTFEFDKKGKRTVVDYDGVFSLPDQAMDLLEKHGVDCTEMRKSMAA